MSPATIRALTEFITAVRELAIALGTGWFAFIVIFVTVVWFGSLMWREHRRGQLTRQLIDAKEREITRLAEDNRRYREVYLAALGLPRDVLEADRADAEEAAEERSSRRSRRERS